MGTPRPGRSMMWLALAIFVVLILLAAAGCARPTKTIAFSATSTPAKTGMTITIDMTFSPGSENTATTYPHEWANERSPFTHYQIADVGTVHSYRMVVLAIEPGQRVTCVTSISGLVVDTHTSTYPKPAVCGGPPV